MHQPPPCGPAPDAAALAARHAAVRQQTMRLAEPLSEADAQVQSMPDVSPTKWHLAHVTWFFETFVLERHEPGFRPHDPAYRVLYNSYYQGIGAQHPRSQRGLVSRPSLAEVKRYRAAVDERVQALLAGAPSREVLALVALGLQHEQQHQELLLTDILHVLSCNPLAPAYRPQGGPAVATQAQARPAGWVPHDGGLAHAGHDGEGFAFDNEGPRHPVLLHPHALADRLVSQADWAAFIADGAYRDVRWWLSAGWDWVRGQGVEAPLHWRRDGEGGWAVFTLDGLLPPEPDAPVAHVSYFEADAYARWHAATHASGARLPTEFEWEAAAAQAGDAAIARGHFVDDGALRPQPPGPSPDGTPRAMFGDVWCWTASSYLPYPGFRPWGGAVGEYNGKFMVDQMVLRGGSCATPRAHMRPTYRNFFPTTARWQFSGLRLARDLA